MFTADVISMSNTEQAHVSNFAPERKMRRSRKSSVSKETAMRRESGSRPLQVMWGAVLCLNPATEDRDKDKEEGGIKMSWVFPRQELTKGQSQQPDVVWG